MTLLLIIAVVLAGVRAVNYGASWSHRRQAEHLLSGLRQVDFEHSSQSDLQRIFADMPAYTRSTSSRREGGQYIEFQVLNNSYKLSDTLSGHLFPYFKPLYSRWLEQRWTMFAVSFMIASNQIQELQVYEMQETDEGLPHPYAAHTALYRISTEPSYILLNMRGKHYSVYERGTAQYGGEKLDKLIREWPKLNRFVTMDEFAAPEQRRKAFDFHLECFTRVRGCQDVNRILVPLPEN